MNDRPTPREVIEAMARFRQMNVADVLGASRSRRASEARQAASLILHDWLGYSYPEIAQAFDRQSHSPFGAAAHRMRERLEESEHDDAVMAALRERMGDTKGG